MNQEFQLFIYTHKKFIFNPNTDWVTLTGYENDLNIGYDYLCLENFEDNVRNILPNPEQYDNKRIGYLFQTVASEYWILKYLKDVKYVGVSGYRRYPYFRFPREDFNPVINVPATAENMCILTSSENLNIAKEILGVYDVIAPRKLNFNCSVANQFINSTKIPNIWSLFIECLVEIVPEYKSKIGWFDMSYSGNYFGTMGMTPLSLFKEYADIYIRIVSLMLKNCSDPWFVEDTNQPYSDRWIGFVAERFYSFFLFVNKVSVFEVQTVLLV